jgi:hypothetical protein
MNSAARISRWLGIHALLVWWISSLAATAATATLYATRFEHSEGFRTNAFLAGQNGWTNAGSGGNGIVTNYILGLGQQAYVGYFPPNGSDRLLSVWKPVNFAPSNAALVHFSVEMSVIDSSTTNRDEFYWTVYNTAGERLFAVLFNNRDLSIKHELDDGYLYDNGWGFENGVSYTLDVAMSFSSNLWNAFLNGTQIVTNEPITTTGAARTFGDVDAEWYLPTPAKPGNNYLLFDNYTITADPLPSVIPSLQPPIVAGGGQRNVRVNGKSNARYAIEASTNLVSWGALSTNTAGGAGYFDYLDTGAAGLRQRFYRARWVP